MSVSFVVRGVAVWSEQAGKPAAALLPARMRGRASPLTAMLAEVVEQACRAAALDPATLPSVFGSAYGEMHTTGVLLSQLLAAGSALSPAKFQASVHNTAAAQLSIALHNPSFTTSIAAGYDTVAMSLVEAGGWLAHAPGPMVVACADEAPHERLQPGASYSPVAVAFVLDSGSATGLARIQLVEGESQAASWADNPVADGVVLARAVLAGRHASVSLHGGYRVSVEPDAGGTRRDDR